MIVRTLVALLAFTLAACGGDEVVVAKGPVPPPGAEGLPPDALVPVTLSTSRSSPDWITFAHQRDCPLGPPTGERCPYGQIAYNQRTITRTADGRLANMWLQTHHGTPQLWAVPLEDGGRRTIRYERMRVHYRFNCADETFAIIERQILGANEVVVGGDSPPEIYRAPARWSPVAIAMPIACRGA